jgi:hypothetical protein
MPVADTEPEHDAVLFEIVTREAATSLLHRLTANRTSWMHQLGAIWIVGAATSEGVDLAVLLRDVEQWVAREGLGAIRFWVDELDYILESGEVAWSALAA